MKDSPFKRILYKALPLVITCFNIAVAGDASKVSPVPCETDIVPMPLPLPPKYEPPKKVYCEHSKCGGEFCCPKGYLYSNPCTCKCYKSSQDALSECDTAFICIDFELNLQ